MINLGADLDDTSNEFARSIHACLAPPSRIERAERANSRIWRILRPVRKITEQRTVTIGEGINEQVATNECTTP